MKQRGFIHLLPLLILAALIGAGIYFVYKGNIKLPSIPLLQTGPKVQLKSEYQNPFKKESQYVNPFDKYKNPFVVNR